MNCAPPLQYQTLRLWLYVCYYQWLLHIHLFLLLSSFCFSVTNALKHVLYGRSSGGELLQFCLGKSLFLLYFWRRVLPGTYSILGWQFFLSIVWKAVPWCWMGLQDALQLGCWLCSAGGHGCQLDSLVERGSQLYLIVGWGYRLCFEASQDHCSGFQVMCGATSYDQQLGRDAGLATGQTCRAAGWASWLLGFFGWLRLEVMLSS